MPYRGRGKRPFHMSAQDAPQQKREAVDESSPVIAAFLVYRGQLDEKHDRYERIVKLSRDVTIRSKRCIFLMHRVSGLSGDARTSVLNEAETELTAIRQALWKHVAKELEDQDPYHYQRAYSPGLQEYIEAVSLHYYHHHKAIVPLATIQDQLKFPQKVATTQDDASSHPPTEADTVSSPMTCDPDSADTPPPAPVPPTLCVNVHPLEYVLGLADLSGELMRLAITSVGVGDAETARELCGFLRHMHDALTSLRAPRDCRDLATKLRVMGQSLRKVETACYTVTVRGEEIPRHMLTQTLMALPAEQTE